MLLFIAALLIYIGILLFVKPSPESLKEPQLSFGENILKIRASLVLGISLIVIFFVTSDFKFINVSEEILVSFSVFDLKSIFSYRVLTHLFIHLDLVHLLSNITAIGICSLYERRVGIKRYLIVLALSAFISSFSILIYSQSLMSCGISGGAFGLLAAYVTDHQASKKQWFLGLFVFIILFVLVCVNDKIQDNNNYNIDYFAHILGAITAIIYCRVTIYRFRKTTAYIE